ncbi:hypothetical protein [Streptomyces hypolithicus]
MRAIRLAPAAALGLAALSLSAPTALAAQSADGKAPGPVVGTATPSTVSPGGQVTLSVTGCDGPARAMSGVFDTATIADGGSAYARVDFDAKPGAVYTVTYTCDDDGRTATADLTIAGGTTPAPTRTPTATATRTVSSTTAPTRPARGGVGGSVDGMNAGEIAAGAALVVAAIGGTVYVVRRRSGNRQH